MANLFLLGAGASYGSEPSEVSKVPPLGDQLFDRLHAKGGAASQVPDHIKEMFKENFEAGMEEYDRWSNRDVMSFQRELAGYLASFSPTENNYYKKMIKELGTKRFVYCSLNYDLLLEMSAAKLGLNTLYGVDPGNHLKLLKLHGSSNFWPDLGAGSIRGCKFSGNGQDISAPIRPVTQWAVIEKCMTEDSLAPAMCVYAPGKRSNISQEYVYAQQNLWKKKLKSSRKVFVSGVGVNMCDEHVWGSLGKAKADVFYYGFPSDKEGFLEWKEVYGKRNSYFKELDFHGAIFDIKNKVM